MNVYCVVLNILDEEGIATVRSYPELLSKRKLEQLSKEVLNKDSFEGQILTGVFENRVYISYCLLTVHDNKTILTTIVILYQNPTIDWEKAKSKIIEVIKGFKEKTGINLVNVADNFHELYSDLQPTVMKFESSSSYIVSIEPLRKELPKKDVFDSLKEDFWDEDAFDDEEEDQIIETQKEEMYKINIEDEE